MTVEKTADFAAAFKAAEKSGKPAIIHLKVDTNASTPGLTLEGDPRQGAGQSEAVSAHSTFMPRSFTTLPQVSRSDLIWAA